MSLGLPLNSYCVFNVMNILVTVSLSISLYYCIVYSAIQPLKAASVLNKISCRLSDVDAKTNGDTD